MVDDTVAKNGVCSSSVFATFCHILVHRSYVVKKLHSELMA